jgi:hypothetical protein
VKRRTWVLATTTVAAVVAGAVLIGSRDKEPATARDTPTNTAPVQRGTLTAEISQSGTLTYRAQPNGAPYPVVNQAGGTYTALPTDGAEVACGDVLYRVDDRPVLALCGTVPAYRELRAGLTGHDVRQLNASLHALGHDTAAGVAINPDDNAFTWRTQQALRVLQHAKGLQLTGKLAFGDVVFLPGSVRIAAVTGALGGPAQPGAPVAQATSNIIEVQVALDPSQQGEVNPGDAARVTLPGNRSVPGKVDRLGRVAQVATGQTAATVPAYVSLDDPTAARGLDRAPVLVRITTTEVGNALSVPVTALVGAAGGGYAVEVVRPDGRRELVAVRLGLFDAAGGRVQVEEGTLREGDRVVVP